MIVVFDGLCNFCNGWVRFVLNRPGGERFQFAAAQTKSGELLLAKYGFSSSNLETMLFIYDESCFTKSEAVINILVVLGGPWKLAFIARLVPRVVRDKLYDFIARNRRKIWGQRDVCMVPENHHKAQFLE